MTVAPLRHIASHPGALLHQDHEKLGRIPDGRGWRVAGRSNRPHQGHANVGYEHLKVLIDDTSRYTFVVPVPETAASAVLALETAAAELARLGIRIERVFTDCGPSYLSRHSTPRLLILAPRHKGTRRYRPQTNGKAKRVIQTLLNEWAYRKPYRMNWER